MTNICWLVITSVYKISKFPLNILLLLLSLILATWNRNSITQQTLGAICVNTYMYHKIIEDTHKYPEQQLYLQEAQLMPTYVLINFSAKFCRMVWKTFPLQKPHCEVFFGKSSGEQEIFWVRKNSRPEENFENAQTPAQTCQSK